MVRNGAEHLKARLIQWLLSGNLDFNRRKHAIGIEVSFSSNKRKADLVIFGREFHAFEIKGKHDRLGKLRDQLKDYHSTFDKVTVVVAPNHLKRVKKEIRPYTGLILVKEGDFEVLRKPNPKKRLKKYSLLMFLTKNEIARLLKLSNVNNYSTDEVRRMAEKKLPLEQIHRASLSALKGRYEKLFRLFLQDKGIDIHIDDLLSLSGYVKELI